jgi:hypothetical protein
MKKAVLVATVLMMFGTVASAATSSGTLTVTGTVESSINLTIESAGGTTSGTGTAAATSALGNISKYGSAPTGFTLARGASDWTLSSTVDVKVDKANLTSTDYTLTGQLGSAPASGVTWKLNGSTLSDSAAATLTSTGTYGSTGLLLWGHRRRRQRFRRRDRQRDQLHRDLELEVITAEDRADEHAHDTISDRHGPHLPHLISSDTHRPCGSRRRVVAVSLLLVPGDPRSPARRPRCRNDVWRGGAKKRRSRAAP